MRPSSSLVQRASTHAGFLTMSVISVRLALRAHVAVERHAVQRRPCAEGLRRRARCGACRRLRLACAEQREVDGDGKRRKQALARRRQWHWKLWAEISPLP